MFTYLFEELRTMSEMTTATKANTEVITFGEMSELFGYQASSLNVMSKRYADFPKPVDAPSNETDGRLKFFSRAEIEAWFEGYFSRGGSKLGNGRASGGRGVSRTKRVASNPLLEEILTRIGNDLVLQSKVLIYLEQVKQG
jgi:predicted DNA-binding transcriptional regulator AlpA